MSQWLNFIELKIVDSLLKLNADIRTDPWWAMLNIQQGVGTKISIINLSVFFALMLLHRSMHF